MAKRTDEDYYIESKRIRKEVLLQAEQLKGNPQKFIITNGITMRVEITKTDLKELRFNKSLADSNGALVLNGV